MRCTLRAATAVAFHPHLHRENCRICAAAASAHAPGTASADAKRAALSSASRAPPRACSSNEAPRVLTPALSGEEARREALLEWMRRFSPRRPAASAFQENGSDAATAVADGLHSGESFDAAFAAYMGSDDAAVRDGLFTKLLECLDAQCDQSAVRLHAEPTRHAARDSSRDADTVRIPRCLVVPRGSDDSGASAMPRQQPSATTPSCAGGAASKVAVNDFEAHVRRRFCGADAAAVIAKQLRFQTALLAMQELLDRHGIRFFLACGTALGARREGCFIPHDEDIDLGIFYDDLAVPVQDDAAAAAPDLSAAHSLPRLPGLSCVQARVFGLLSALASSRVFVVFDMCGFIDKGLELRVLHLGTNVRIDVNLYYAPIETSGDDVGDAALVRSGGAFVWAASFYEAADQRRHGMYRYRHRPFDTELETLPFCALAAENGRGFLVPPERYLVETYGEEWRTPKKYSYTDGLAGEFKNILPE
ncbi:LicD family [Novymonas esmeraldas]|uniref:LicD family n=1 Tax=Novymonas esmeraldas TaxID=1808958 RepID=A0AAW0F1I7_9TRYP